MTKALRDDAKPRLYKKAHPVKWDKEQWELYAATKPPFCLCCGRMYQNNLEFKREFHHICRFKRSDEECNLLAICARCHAIYHGGVFKDGAGESIPQLHMGHMLWIKRHREPGEWKRERLTTLYGQALASMQKPPKYFMEQWERNRGTT